METNRAVGQLLIWPLLVLALPGTASTCEGASASCSGDGSYLGACGAVLPADEMQALSPSLPSPKCPPELLSHR